MRLLPFTFLLAAVIPQESAGIVREYGVAALKDSLSIHTDFHSAAFSFPSFAEQAIWPDGFEWEDREGEGEGGASPLEFTFDMGVPRVNGRRGQDWESGLSDFLPRPVPVIAIDETSQGVLTVEAPNLIHARIDQVLEGLRQHAQRTGSVACYRVKTPQGRIQFDPVLTQSQVLALLHSFETAEPIRTRARLGRRSALRDLRTQEIVVSTYNDSTWQEDGTYSYEFEIETSALRQGADFAVRVLPSPTGAYLLRVRGRCGDDASLGSQVLSLPGGDACIIDTLEMRGQRFEASASLHVGEGLLLGTDHEESGAWLFVLEDAPEDATSFSMETDQFLATGALAQDLTPLRFALPDGPRPTGGWGWWWWSDENHFGTGSMPDPHPFIRRSDLNELLSALGGNSDRDALLPWIEDVARVPRGTEMAQRASDLLRELAQQTDKSIAMELRFGEFDTLLAEQWLARDLQVAATDLPNRTWGACLIGSGTAMMSGREYSYLADVTNDWSQTIFPGNPRLHRLLDGFVFRCSVWRTRLGDLSARAEFSVQHILDFGTRVPLAKGDVPPTAAKPTELPLPRTSVVSLDASLRGKPGEWMLLGASELEGTGRTVVAALRFVP